MSPTRLSPLPGDCKPETLRARIRSVTGTRSSLQRTLRRFLTSSISTRPKIPRKTNDRPFPGRVRGGVARHRSRVHRSTQSRPALLARPPGRRRLLTLLSLRPRRLPLRVALCSLVLAAAALLATAQGPVEVIHNPADSIIYAAKDLETIRADFRPFMRYFTFYNVPAKQLEQEIKVFNGHVHHLSILQDIIPASIVPGSSGTLVRVNLLDYGW